jgi:hypothetical protein
MRDHQTQGALARREGLPIASIGDEDDRIREGWI